MAETKTQTTKSSSTTADRNGNKGSAGILAGAQDVADTVRSTAERAAEKWPEVASGAQIAARDTQKALERMPNQGLIIGTSFSLGLGVGLFMTGANRLLVLFALAPAAAMIATLLGRDEDAATQS